MVVLWRNSLQQLYLPHSCDQGPTASRTHIKLHDMNVPRKNTSLPLQIALFFPSLSGDTCSWRLYNIQRLRTPPVYHVPWLYTVIASSFSNERSHNWIKFTRSQTFPAAINPRGTLIHSLDPCAPVQRGAPPLPPRLPSTQHCRQTRASA